MSFAYLGTHGFEVRLLLSINHSRSFVKFMDYMMPDMDGNHIKTQQREKDVMPYNQTALYDTLVIVYDACGRFALAN